MARHVGAQPTLDGAIPEGWWHSTAWSRDHTDGGSGMAESVDKVIELVGTSTESWERAAAVAVEKAGQSLRDLRIAEVVQLDMQLEGGAVVAYRAKVNVSSKYEGGD
jgi:dodecin